MAVQTRWTARDLEWAKDVMDASDIAYWADARWSDGVLLVREIDEDQTYRVSPTDLLDWLAEGTGPRELVKVLGDPYQRLAVTDLAARNWDALDYDAETGDLVLQYMLLSEVRYG